MEVRSIEHGIRARMGSWPHEPDVAHLVLLDHQMVPSGRHVAAWIETARARGARALRTGALFPDSTPAFRDAGFEPIDRLALLERPMPLSHQVERPAIRTRPLRFRQLAKAADVDRRSFPPPWGNDRGALVEVLQATPQRRARAVVVDRSIVAFAISGVANRTGYLQRLAVDPGMQRTGYGRALALDALAWMQRRGATTALVNTAFDNVAALALYRALGFDDRDDSLMILELELMR